MRSFTSGEYGELTKWLGEAGREALRRASLATAARMVSVIQNEVIPQEDPQPVDRGIYRAAWQYEPTENGADVWNSLPYAPIIEFGARASKIKIGRAMIAALTEWVMRKGLARGNKQKPEQVAWAIAVAMKRRGIFKEGTGLHIAEKAQERAQPLILEEFARELARQLSR
jgi:hypothetical protein